MRKILITGATGFIGANLVRSLINDGNSDIYITARRSSDFWRIKDVISQVRKMSYCNLDNRNEVFQCIGKLRPNVILHTATYGGLPTQTESDLMVNANLNATIHLLDAAMLYGVEQFIHTGSSSEYGIKHAPMKETDLCEPVNLYGITKLAATNYCTMMGKRHNYKVCTLRLFSPYGPYEEPSRLYPSIVNALSVNERPRLSRPNLVRDFIAVDQVIGVYKAVMHTDFIPGDIINVGSGQQQTIDQFYREIARSMNKRIEPIYGEAPQRANEPVKWEADNGKMKELLEKTGSNE